MIPNNPAIEPGPARSVNRSALIVVAFEIGIGAIFYGFWLACHILNSSALLFLIIAMLALAFGIMMVVDILDDDI